MIIGQESSLGYKSIKVCSRPGQGCKEMGFRAAKMLHNRLVRDAEQENHSSTSSKPARVLVPPTKVFERQSTDFQALKDPYVIQAMHFIRHNACKGIKVDQVLDNVGISRSNMEARFREERNHSIHQEIHNAKLKRACSLLKGTSLPILEIAELCGYPSLQYMYTVFKKNLDQTPKCFRENAKIA